ncbi:hypothetical protein VNO80_26102 [Phaseolus coccineus]|uniref:Peptidase A1 domain-containing protein n=1 Tax=Phaseolus coccineus TaxID=3886 RepID=A0AAN9LW02_PHACN
MSVMNIMSRYSSLVFVLLCLRNLYSLEALNGGFSVEMIHRDSSKSPFYNSTETHFQRIANALSRSIIRVNHFNKSFVSANTPQAPVTSAQGEYLMSYYIGTPLIQVYGILDTGSDITWLQCQPCQTCFKQITPIFDPSKSKTYKTIGCNTNTCRYVQGTCPSSTTSSCKYSISYGDGSYSEGDLSLETITLASTNGSPFKIPSTVVGCAQNNHLAFERGGSGIVALGNAPVSLVNQMGPSIGGKFSYCLVPTLSPPSISSKLNFGNAAMVSGPGTVSTPFYSREPEEFYYLNLEAISVGRNRIEVGSTLPRAGGKGNIVIDSGTTITFLPSDAYSKLESAVAKEVKLQSAKDPNQVLSLCYKAKSDKLDVPVITAHFTGADVILYGSSTFMKVADGVVCLAFVPNQSTPIFGNLAQQNILVGYDLQKKTVSFKPVDCTKQ